MCAISGVRGSSGLGSVNMEQIDSSTCRCKTNFTQGFQNPPLAGPGSCSTVISKGCLDRHGDASRENQRPDVGQVFAVTAGLLDLLTECSAGRDVTFDIVSAGLHCSLRMSRQMLPCELMFGWYTFVWNCTCIA